jgi:hypothetical protein
MKLVMLLITFWRNNMLINSVYGMSIPKPTKEHLKKLQAAIDYLGDKYRLHTPIQKGESK